MRGVAHDKRSLRKIPCRLLCSRFTATTTRKLYSFSGKIVSGFWLAHSRPLRFEICVPWQNPCESEEKLLYARTIAMSLHRSQWSAELPVLTWDSPDDTSSLTRCRSMSSDLHCPSLGSNSLFKGKTVSATQSSFADFLAPTNNLRGPATAGSNGSNNDAARLSPGRAKNASSPLDNSSLIDRQIEEDIGNLLSEMKGMSRGVDALLSKMNTRKTMCHRRRMSRSLPDLSVLKSPEKRPNHTAAASRDRKSEAANKRAVGSARTRRPAHGKSSSKSKAGSVPCPGYGCTSLAGSHHAHLGKKKQNQDSFLVHRDFPTKGALVFAIFDGHGRKGKSVSKFCADNFVSCLQKCNFHKTKANRHAAISKAFQMLHRQLHNTNFDTVESGSTAVACILLPAEQKAVVINCGDSRVCVGSVMPSGVSEPPKSKTPKGVRLTPGQFALDGGKPTSHSRTSSTPSTLKPLFHIKFLLRAHKPTEPKERRRIEAAGGVVYCMEGTFFDIPFYDHCLRFR